MSDSLTPVNSRGERYLLESLALQDNLQAKHIVNTYYTSQDVTNDRNPSLRNSNKARNLWPQPSHDENDDGWQWLMHGRGLTLTVLRRHYAPNISDDLRPLQHETSNRWLQIRRKHKTVNLGLCTIEMHHFSTFNILLGSKEFLLADLRWLLSSTYNKTSRVM